MRVVVTGATGNVGTSLVARLVADPSIDQVVGVARRTGSLPFPGVELVGCDVGSSDLRPVFEGADAVVHLAWAIQPSHDEATLWQTNVLGTERVFESARKAGVGTIIHASSVGAYSAGPREVAVDENWPTDGTPTSFYARHKATTERYIDVFERAHRSVRVVRMRPALTFKRQAATGIRRLFLGPLFPNGVLRGIPASPVVAGLTFQVVHTDDVAAAYHSALTSDVSGPFNLAAEPLLDLAAVASLLDAGTFRTPLRALRAAASASWHLRMQPTPPGWLDMAAAVPLMSSHRAIDELGWKPLHTAEATLAELLEGIADSADFPTAPLARETAGRLRRNELSGTATPPSQRHSRRRLRTSPSG
jgi:UDP-glucose 4-epimerase